MIETFNGIASYSYGIAGKVWKKELIQSLNIKWLILIMFRMKMKQGTTQIGLTFQTIHKEY